MPTWANPARRPNPWQSQQDFFKTISLNLCVYGNAIVTPRTRGFQGNHPDQLVAHPWWNISLSVAGEKMTGMEAIDPMNNDALMGIPGYGSSYKQVSYTVDGQSGLMPLNSLMPDGDVLHLRWANLQNVLFGQSPRLVWAAPEVRTAVAADAYAELSFLFGFAPFGMLAHKGGKPGEGLVKGMREYLRTSQRNPQNRMGPFVASGEWNYTPFNTRPEDLQLLSTRKMAYNLASSLFGVSPDLLGQPRRQIFGVGYPVCSAGVGSSSRQGPSDDDFEPVV